MEGWIEPPARVSEDVESDFERRGIVDVDEEEDVVEEDEDEEEGRKVNP